MSSRSSNSSILIILDLDYGIKLRQLPACRPMWVAMSVVNAPVVRLLWEVRPDRGSVLGITGFRVDDSDSANASFLGILDAIDIHHGPHSFPNEPYVELEVIGSPLSIDVRYPLSKVGFAEFIEQENGFLARRSREAADRLRD